MEIQSSINEIGYYFENLNGLDADDLHHLVSTEWVGRGARAKFTNATNVHFRSINFNATLSDVGQNFIADQNSRIRMDETEARFDHGYLDDPRFDIGGFWNATTKTYVNLYNIRTGQNVLPNANFENGLQGWNFYWNTTGTAVIETLQDGKKRLKVTPAAAPGGNGFYTRLTIPPEMKGKTGYFVFNLSYSGSDMWATPYMRNSTGLSRAIGTLTAIELQNIQESELLLNFLVRGTSGTVYIQ